MPPPMILILMILMPTDNSMQYEDENSPVWIIDPHRGISLLQIYRFTFRSVHLNTRLEVAR